MLGRVCAALTAVAAVIALAASPATASLPGPNAASAGFPNVASTGIPTGTNLRGVPDKVTSGPGWYWNANGGYVAITGDNVAFTGFKVKGSIEVYGKNAVISADEVVTGGNGHGVGLRAGSAGTIVEDSAIHGLDLGSGRLLYGVTNVTADDPTVQVLRNNIYYVSHGVQLDEGLVQDNFIHGLGFVSNDHTEGVFSGGGVTGQLTIRHNTITDEQGQVAAIILSGAFGKQTNVAIDHNLLTGGGYTVYGGGNPDVGSSGITVTNNSFSTSVWPNGGYYGSPVYDFTPSDPGNAWSGNTWFDGPNKGHAIAADGTTS